MIIELNEENVQDNKLIEVMKQAGEMCLSEEGLPFSDDDTEISLSFVSEEEIKKINFQYRNVDKITDVLSFPQYNNQEEMKDEEYLCLGDVIICPQIAAKQAEEYGHSYVREMVYLMVHSMFHLLGYDHIEDIDKTIMREKEEIIMNKIGVLR